MAQAYTTKQAVENYLNQNIDESFNDQLDRHIAAMTEWIDQTVGYPVFSEEVTTRRYDGSNAPTITIDPVHTISEVKVDDVVVEPFEKPYNTHIKTELAFTTRHFNRGMGNVHVTGIHALRKDLPEPIFFACTVFVAVVMNQVRDQNAGVKSEKIGDYQVSFTDDKERSDFKEAKDIVLSYKPITF